jgi:REP element-mobilizing transposase RayT
MLVPFNPYEPVEITKANLPHWRQDRTTYFVTFRLGDSLPREKLDRWTRERDLWRNAHPEPLSDEEKAEYYEIFARRIEVWLDRGSGSCILRDPQCRDLTETALRFFDGERYHLGAHVVAANHVHALVTPFADKDLSELLHSWKSYTSKEILKLPVSRKVSTRPTIWQKESHNHIVRSPAALRKIEAYIRAHP